MASIGTLLSYYARKQVVNAANQTNGLSTTPERNTTSENSDVDDEVINSISWLLTVRATEAIYALNRQNPTILTIFTATQYKRVLDFFERYVP